MKSDQRMPISIMVSKDFSETPGPRSRDEGEYSGDEFLDSLLEPRFRQALEQKTTLLVDLDGTEGYATSFLEAAFGGLARKFGSEPVLGNIDLKSNDEPYLIEEIRTYVKEAGEKKWDGLLC